MKLKLAIGDRRLISVRIYAFLHCYDIPSSPLWADDDDDDDDDEAGRQARDEGALSVPLLL